MEVTHTKVRRQRRRGVYRLPISAAASAKWQKDKDGDSRTAQPQTQTRGRRGKRDKAVLAEERAGLLMAAADTERPQGPTTGWGADGGGQGLCEDAFKQFVHECDKDIKASSGSFGANRLSLQCTTAQSDVGGSDGCVNNEPGRELDVGGVGHQTESDTVLRLTGVKFNECEEFLKVPEADTVRDLGDLSYDSVLQPSSSEGGIEPVQNRETIPTNVGSQEQSSTAEHTNSSDEFPRKGNACATPLLQMHQDGPEQSRERDAVGTELTAEESDSSFNIAQLYESCSPSFAQDTSLGTAEDRKDIVTHRTEEQDPWGKSITLDQNCNLLDVSGEQTNTISEVSSAVENLLNEFDPTRIKVENSEPIFQGIEGTQEYILLEDDEEVVMTLAVGDGGQLVPTAGDHSLQLPPGLTAQLAASQCVTAAPGADADATAPCAYLCTFPYVATTLNCILTHLHCSKQLADQAVVAEAARRSRRRRCCCRTQTWCWRGRPSRRPSRAWARRRQRCVLLLLSKPLSLQQRRREERLHFGDVEEALDAIENGGQPRRQRPRLQHKAQHRAPHAAGTPPARMGSGVHKEVERAAKALFSKRTRTLYHWMYPDTPKRKLKATVASAWDTLPESEKLIYMSQVMGRFGTPASNLMVNPQLVGMSADQLETECAVAGLLAAEAEAAAAQAQEDVDVDDAQPCRALRKRPLALPAYHGKRPRASQEHIFSDTELDPCKQDTDDEISTAELFAPLGI